MLLYPPLLLFVALLALLRWRAIRAWGASAPSPWHYLLPLWWSYPELRERGRGKRLIFLAGELAATNLVIAILSVTAMATFGLPTGEGLARVDEVVPDMPADGALLPGDIVTHVGSEPAMIRHNGESLIQISTLLQSPEATDLRVMRKNKVMTIRIQPREVEDTGRYEVGIHLSYEREIRRSIRWGAAFQVPIIEAKLVVQRIRELAVGRNEEEFSGPVSMARMQRARNPAFGIYSGILYTGRLFWFLLICSLVCAILPVRPTRHASP